MAVNVRPEFYTQGDEETNKVCSSMVVNQVYPVQSNITSGIMSGDFAYEISLGANQYLDLFKTHMVVRFTPTFDTAAESLHNYAVCVWDRALMYVNGKLVASSNNYTEDGMLSRRLQFSSQYNKTVNDFTYTVPGTAGTDGTVYTTAVAASDIDTMDSFYFKTPNLIIPPNSNVRFVFTTSATSNGIKKSLVAANTGSVMTTSISAIYMNAFIISNTIPTPEKYQLNFITMDSFKTTAGAGTSVDIQHQTKANLVRLAAALVSNVADTRTTTAVKTYSIPVFKYATDTSTTKVNTLYFKAGNVMLPQQQFDTSFGAQEIWQAFNQYADGSLDSAGKETRFEFEYRGYIWTVPVVRGYGDQSKNVELHLTVADTAAANVVLWACYEQMITFMYDNNGIQIDTIKAI
jgi:hypothetical protein